MRKLCHVIVYKNLIYFLLVSRQPCSSQDRFGGLSKEANSRMDSRDNPKGREEPPQGDSNAEKSSLEKSDYGRRNNGDHDNFLVGGVNTSQQEEDDNDLERGEGTEDGGGSDPKVVRVGGEEKEIAEENVLGMVGEAVTKPHGMKAATVKLTRADAAMIKTYIIYEHACDLNLKELT